ncbi:MAG: DUF742 domain-containing protein [Pseudonocardiaceae bacterium]|nr:DUF742 domain-containing protein [Pseudonocardiaceae bacterium]
MNARDDAWFDDAAGSLVRPYALTGGRTRATDNFGLDLITLVVAMSSPADVVGMEPEYAGIVRLCQQPLSVAEVASHMELPLPVVKVMLSDLIERNHVLYRTATPMTEAPNLHTLQAVLDGIRKL